MSTFEQRLVQAVERKRKALGLSLRALANIVGVSFSSLARMERGEGEPDNNSKIRLLQWLGPDAKEAGLSFESVAFVHFRALKNIRSSTVQTLLKAAASLRESLGDQTDRPLDNGDDIAPDEGAIRSKQELEELAEKFRADLGLSPDEALDSLRLDVDGVSVIAAGKATCLDARTLSHLRGWAASEWSAMSVPLDPENQRWAVLLNDTHGVERQRVTVLEELWHILLGHKLTKIARVADAYGRTYDTTEEHDAYYLAAATLLPRTAIDEAVNKKLSSQEISKRFGTSSELVEYRVKRLGLWRQHTGKQVRLRD